MALAAQRSTMPGKSTTGRIGQRWQPNCKNCILVRRDGFEFGIENKVTPIHDQDGEVTGAVVAFHDVSAARAKSLEMSHLAQHDALTDLPNRVLFNDRLTQAISLAVRQGKQLAVMFVDLDHFKKDQRLAGPRGGRQTAAVGGRAIDGLCPAVGHDKPARRG